jgi:hypothetical protein
MVNELNGFYAGFMSGAAGQGVAVFVFRDGVIVGADFSGSKFDGIVKQKSKSSVYDCVVKVSLPPNGQTIQGVETGPSGINYEAVFELAADFSSKPFFYIDTPLGGVNIRLEKVRDLGVTDA